MNPIIHRGSGPPPLTGLDSDVDFAPAMPSLVELVLRGDVATPSPSVLRAVASTPEHTAGFIGRPAVGAAAVTVSDARRAEVRSATAVAL